MNTLNRGFRKNRKYRAPETEYVQLQQSHTEFLNFGGSRKERKELDAIRDDYFKRIDALPASDKAGRDALFAELEAKLIEKKASNEQINEARSAKQKSERGEKISKGLSKALDIFTKTTQALGIGKGVEGEQRSSTTPPTAANGSQNETKTPMWVWVVGGAVVVGLGVFAIYKSKK